MDSKKNPIFAVSLLLVLVARPVVANDVGCYYYWVNERVDPEGVKKDLRWMKSVGITKAFLATDIRNRFRVEDPWAGQEFGPNEFMSEHWWKCLETALVTAGELGIEMGIFNCPGWSQSGGPWVKPEEAMRYWDVAKGAPAVCQDPAGGPLCNSPCSFKATGLEVDKLNRKHVRKHFDSFIGEILRRIPAKKRKTLTTVVIDSWERGNKQNYTDGIFEKFEQRFGYKLDYADKNCEKDLRWLLSDLVAEEYMGELTRCAHEHGLKTWCEPYAHGSPFPGNAIDYGAQADMVAAEFWVHDRKFRDREMWNALGAAKKKGTNRVYAESFTDGNWKTHAKDDWTFAALKPIADKYHAAGVTDFVLHVVISQPGDDNAPPVRPWFGSFFDRRSKHADEVKTLVDYLKSLSSSASETNTPFVAKWRGNRAAAVSFTFDDGLRDQYELAFPKMEELGLKGTFFLNGGSIESQKPTRQGALRMTWDMVKEMSDAGMEMSNHGLNHANHGRTSRDAVEVDIASNDVLIARHTGKKPITYAYPNNAKNKEWSAAVVNPGRVGSRMRQTSFGGKHNVESGRKLFAKAKADRSWLVLMTHAVKHGYDQWRDSEMFYALLADAAHDKDLWIDTFAAVAIYERLRDETKVAVTRNEKGWHVAVAPPSLDKKLFAGTLDLVLPNGTVRSFDPFGGDFDITEEN